MKITKFIFCLKFIAFYSMSNAYANVNCSSDFTRGVNYIIAADTSFNNFKLHDMKHEEFIFENQLPLAKNEVLLAIDYAQAAQVDYQKAKELFTAIADFGCWRKVKKSIEKIQYINWKLDKIKQSSEILRMISHHL